MAVAAEWRMREAPRGLALSTPALPKARRTIWAIAALEANGRCGAWTVRNTLVSSRRGRISSM